MRYWNGYQYAEFPKPTIEERVEMLEQELEEISSPRTTTSEEVGLDVNFEVEHAEADLKKLMEEYDGPH